MLTKIANFVIFQIGWIIAVILHNDHAALMCLLLAVLNYLITKQYQWQSIMAAIVVTTIGILNDYALIALNLVSFPGQSLFPFPLWLAALWLLFVSTFASSLAWMNRLPLIVLMLLGGLGGSLSYVAGKVLGAMQYHGYLIAQSQLHFINWLILFPIMYRLHAFLSKR